MAPERKVVHCTDGIACKKQGQAFSDEVSSEGPFICLECQKARGAIYGIPLIHFLRDKMGHIRKAKDDENRFAIRELVQNADDAKARIIVVRIDSDALYASNDGEAFLPPTKDRREGDFTRICGVLSEPKAMDADSTGIHGSGFQTVYCFTNHPEVHSNGISARMDPTQVAEGKRIVSLTSQEREKWRSPFHPKGVLFRFPWRTDKEAERDYDGKRHFSSEKHWPRWNRKKIDQLREDLARISRS
jgi:hypothetical protein